MRIVIREKQVVLGVDRNAVGSSEFARAPRFEKITFFIENYDRVWPSIEHVYIVF
jgi:hypothetical protein